MDKANSTLPPASQREDLVRTYFSIAQFIVKYAIAKGGIK